MIQGWLLRWHHPALSLEHGLRAHANSSLYKRGLPSGCRSFSASRRCLIKDETTKTRNIGIIAHIDAGKTTTTERMLYYSGFTRRLGDVDEGSTVTDFLPAERARGITIQSAAISFQWPPLGSNASHSPTKPGNPASSSSHLINLIDTPGHADFTFEVVRSLRVLDGAVCILDGVAGVEAQTEKVWTQASGYAIPRIIFVNKLDRDGAAFERTVKEIGARLNVWPAVCGIPWWTADGKLQGVGDVVGLRGLKYTEGGDGKQVDASSIDDLASFDEKFATEIKDARTALVELLSEHDDAMVEKFLEAEEDHLAITPSDIIASLRSCVLQHPQTLTPVFAGASFRNVGVQPLLDAVVDLLPSPIERPDPEVSVGGGDGKGNLTDFLAGKLVTLSAPQGKSLKKHAKQDTSRTALQKIEACALAFKVVADPKRGVLVYVRVYSGVMHRNAVLWNTNLHATERAQRLLKMYANDAVDIESIPAGQIGVIPGLKFARTGDTLVSVQGMNPKHGPPAPIDSLQLKPIAVPPPVFFVSVEPNSLAEEKHIKESLDVLLREDPSLNVSVDQESGQTHLAGMGELHLEIARDRLVQDLKAKARIGKIEIGYRESLTTASDEVHETFEKEIGGKASKAGCQGTAGPASLEEVAKTKHTHVFDLHDSNRLIVRTPTVYPDGSPVDEEDAPLPETLPLSAVLRALQTGVLASFARGPVHGYPVHSTDIELTFIPTEHVFPTTTLAAISSAARVVTKQALRQSAQSSETVMMEPVMLVTILINEDCLGDVVHDLSSSRGGSVLSLGESESSSVDNEATLTIDVARIYAPPDPFAGGMSSNEGVSSGGSMRQVVARVPLKEMVGYLKHLRSLSGGRGTFTMVVDRFEKMSGMRQKAVLNTLRGDYD